MDRLLVSLLASSLSSRDVHVVKKIERARLLRDLMTDFLSFRSSVGSPHPSDSKPSGGFIQLD